MLGLHARHNRIQKSQNARGGRTQGSRGADMRRAFQGSDPARMKKTVLPTLDNNLSLYLRDVRRFPMLEPEVERDLAVRWRDDRDEDALRQLVGSHLRLVVRIARGYSGYGLPLNDLIAEGNVGLMQGVTKFDPDRGFRLATYAMWWIRASIQEYILKSWSLVKLGTTASQKKLFFNLRRLKGRLNAIDDGDLTPEQVEKIATELGVSENDVVNVNRRLARGDHSLNAPLSADREGEWQDWLVDDTENQEVMLGNRQELLRRRDLLQDGLKRLTDRERHILTERRLSEEHVTLEDLSRQYGISRERVRQIEVQAFTKLQKAILAKQAFNDNDNDALAAA